MKKGKIIRNHKAIINQNTKSKYKIKIKTINQNTESCMIQEIIHDLINFLPG